MSATRFTTCAALTLAAVLLLPHSLAAQPRASTEQLVGVWRLASFVEQRPNGELVPSGRYGPNVTGMIVYDKNGAMMAQLMNPDRPKFASGSATRGTPEEVKLAFDGYNAYYGTYSVDAGSSTIRHKVIGNLFPNAIGSEFIRRYRFEGENLVLELPPAQIEGEQRVVRLVWKRVN
jgi:hypothetical protein